MDTVDIATGAIKVGPALKGAPFDSTINSMTFTPSGLLLAVNSNQGSPAATRLITINVASGVVSTIGNLPDDTDALAFAVIPGKMEEQKMDWRTIALYALFVIALILFLVGILSGRKPRN